MSIVSGTTPTFVLTFPETVDLLDATDIFVTFSRVSTVVTKHTPEIQNDSHSITVALSQEETLRLGFGVVEIQANWLFGDGLRAASDIVTYKFDRQLLTGVLR